ncbi:helix-turn-helix domain-containing protein [Actinoallomurus sp. CA-142502]|uniref:helix-turn-helix domain-containing protein n=1 Tax=Actinoallomurus sp. CA-142502 TaxID=3239885 RepID=UPI003D8EE56E
MPVPAGQLQARRALARELQALLTVSKISQREMAKRVRISQSMASRALNGTATLTNSVITRWARAAGADQTKLDELLTLNEAAARAGAQAIPKGSAVWGFSFTYVEPENAPPFLAVQMPQGELQVEDPDRDLIEEQKRQLYQIASDVITGRYRAGGRSPKEGR